MTGKTTTLSILTGDTLVRIEVSVLDHDLIIAARLWLARLCAMHVFDRCRIVTHTADGGLDKRVKNNSPFV
jgi:hypothetical protein